MRATSNIVTPGLFSQIPQTGAGIPTLPKGSGVAPATGATSSALNSAGSFLNSLFSGVKPQTSSPSVSTGAPTGSGLLGSIFSTPVKSQSITTAPNGTTTVTHTSHTPSANSTGSSGTTLPSTPTPAPITPTPTLTPSQQQAATSQAQYAANQANAANTPAPNTYSGLVGAANQGFTQAGNVGQAIGENIASAESNPNYSLDTGTGIAGLIQQNYGFQGQNLLTRAQGLASLAGTVQPQLGQYGQTYYQPLQAGQTQGGQYGTGPAAAANVQSIQSQTQAVNDYSAARSAAQGLTGQLNTLITQNGINPSDFNAVNRFIQGIMGQTSSPQYQTFSNIINDLAARYAQILTPAGGSQTDMVRTISQSLINATASGQSIAQVLQQLDNQAGNVISGYQKNIANLNSGTNVNQGTGTTGDIYNF